MIPKCRIYCYETQEMIVARDYRELAELFAGLDADDSIYSEPMQSTGLLDEKGNDIFEGDVLRDSESIVIVKFKDGKFNVDYRTMGGKWRNYGSLFDYLKDYEGKIIGDTYQNKELVEG